MNVPSRIFGDQAKCWNCPTVLGQLIPPDRVAEGVWAHAADPLHYETADVPDAMTTAGIPSAG